MTALKPQQVAAYLLRPDLESGLFLAYGRDPGLVREVGRTLSRHFARGRPDDITTLDQGDLEADPARLAIEARTRSLFGDAPVIRLRNPGVGAVAALQDLVGDLAGATVVVEAGNLAPRDALRILAERAPNARALPCYPDDERTIGELLRGTFAKEGIRADADVVPTLAGILGNDREVTRSEIDKLVLYAARSKQLTRNDVLTLCADNAALLLDEIVDAAGTGHAARLDVALTRALGAAASPQQIFAVAIAHFSRLRQWRAAAADGRSAREILEGMRPRPHFSRMRDLEQQLRTWNDKPLAQVLERLQRAVADSRREAPLAPALLRRSLLGIARMAAER